MSAAAVAQGDAVSAAAVAQGDTVSAAAVAQGDTVSAAAVAQGDTVSAAAVAQGDTVSAAAVAQGDTVSAAAVAEGDAVRAAAPQSGATMTGGSDQPADRDPTLGERLHETAGQLLAIGAADDLDEARLEVELLYGEAAGLERAQVIAASGLPAEPEPLARFEGLLRRLLAHEPLAYILGRREFYGLTFEVGPGALIPRPETETLVEATLAAVREHPNARRLVRVADVGTGSGAVALAVARHAPSAQVIATESSTAALVYAGRNRTRLRLLERVVLLTGDLLEPVDQPLDVVATNLPYIPTEEYERLPPEIRTHEPREAVDGGEDGLEAVRALMAQLPPHLAATAVAVLLEVGGGQTGEAGELLLAAVPGGEVAVHRDLAGNRRVVEVRRGY